jgi:hypothetical protein
MPESDDPPQLPAPPFPAEPKPAPPASGGWWIAWIFATVIVPGLIVPLANGVDQNGLMSDYWWVIVGGILILHMVASVKLGWCRSGCLAAALILGGWALMLVSFFVGCISVMSNMNHR